MRPKCVSIPLGSSYRLVSAVPNVIGAPISSRCSSRSIIPSVSIAAHSPRKAPFGLGGDGAGPSSPADSGVRSLSVAGSVYSGLGEHGLTLGALDHRRFADWPPVAIDGRRRHPSQSSVNRLAMLGPRVGCEQAEAIPTPPCIDHSPHFRRYTHASVCRASLWKGGTAALQAEPMDEHA